MSDAISEIKAYIDLSKLKDTLPVTTNPIQTNHAILCDNSLKAIKARIKEDEEFLEYAVQNGYNPNLYIENTSVSNNLYQGDLYSVQYSGYSVKIYNKTKNTTTILNLSNLLVGMSQNDKLNFMKTIQKLPAEVLEDMAIELDCLQSSSGQDMHIIQSNPDFRAGGYYSSSTDSITTNPSSLVHELGHAIDYHGENNMSGKNNMDRITDDSKFKQAFQKGLERYIKAGNKQFDYNDKTTWCKDPIKILKMESNYCTANEKELWAELYTALTTGRCKSYNTIVTYFPEAISVGKELLSSIRAENAGTRHNTPMREITGALINLPKGV